MTPTFLVCVLDVPRATEVDLSLTCNPCSALFLQVQYRVKYITPLEDRVPEMVYFAAECSSFHVITGPNMAGKSTYLRQVALIAILAHIGCFVPAKFASLRTIDRLLTRLGSSDSIENNSSSFMVEMQVRQNATCNLLPAKRYAAILLQSSHDGTLLSRLEKERLWECRRLPTSSAMPQSAAWSSSMSWAGQPQQQVCTSCASSNDRELDGNM